MGFVAGAGIGAILAPEAFPAEAGLAEVGTNLIEIGGGFSAVGGTLEGYAKAGVPGAIAVGGLSIAIDNLGGALTKAAFPGANEAATSAVSALLSQVPEALINARAACD